MIKTVTYIDNLVIKETIMSPYSVLVEDSGEVWEVRCIDGHVNSFNPSKDFSVSARFKEQQEAENFYNTLITPLQTNIGYDNKKLVRSVVS